MAAINGADSTVATNGIGAVGADGGDGAEGAASAVDSTVSALPDAVAVHGRVEQSKCEAITSFSRILLPLPTVQQ